MISNNTNISSARISQLRKIINNTNEEDINMMISDVSYSIRMVLLEAFSNKVKQSKIKNELLGNFLDCFIAGLSLEDIIELNNFIEYYEEKYEACSGDVDDFIAVEETYLQPLNVRIERLLINGSIIPDTENKIVFFEEMEDIIARLKAKVKHETLKNGFSLGYLDADILLDTIKQLGIDSYEIYYGEQMKSYLSSINFIISLNELYKSEEGNILDSFDYHEELNDVIKFDIKCNRFGEEGVGKQELITHFIENGYQRDGDNFTLYSNDHIEIKIYLHGCKFEDYTNEEFTIEVYARRKKNKINSTQFLELSMQKLSMMTEKVINDIYKEFGAPKQKHEFNIERLFEKINDGSDKGGTGVSVKGKNDKNQNTIGNNKTTNKKIKCSNIILENNEMKELEMLKEQFSQEEHFKKYGVEIPKGIVLHGPAGTGKTLFAKIVSNEIDAEFTSISPSDILNKWVGGNEKKIKKVFTQAKKIASKGKKVILFFDEADGLFEKRGDSKTHKEGMISVILQEMDGINEKSLKNIFVFFTTNRLKAIDPAVLSRFDKKIKIGLPKHNKRIELLKLNINERNRKANAKVFKELDYELLAKETKGKSGRFIKQLVNNAVLSFAHSRLSNSKSKLITTQNLIDGIQLIEEENKKNPIGFQYVS